MFSNSSRVARKRRRKNIKSKFSSAVNIFITDTLSRDAILYMCLFLPKSTLVQLANFHQRNVVVVNSPIFTILFFSPSSLDFFILIFIFCIAIKTDTASGKWSGERMRCSLLGYVIQCNNKLHSTFSGQK